MVCSHYPTPTDTETKTDLITTMSKWESVLMSVSVQYEHLHTILYNPFFICLGVCVSVGQCERTIRSDVFMHFHFKITKYSALQIL